MNDWEQRKLDNVIKKLSGGASIEPGDYQSDGVRTIPKGAINDSGVAILSGSKFISKDFFKKNFTSHVSTNDLVTSLRDLVPSAPNLGRVVRIVGIEEEFLMPQGVYKIELFKNMNQDFLISFSNSDQYRKIISQEKNGSTQVHIRNREFLNIKISLPSFEEQQRIGAFFKQLNDLITLHQRKLINVQKLYFGLVKNGKNSLNIQFFEYFNVWEQRKFEEVFDFSISTNSFSRAQLNFEEGIVKSVHYGDILVNYNAILDAEKDKIPFITDGTLVQHKNNLLKDCDIIFADAAEDETVGKAVEVNGIQDSFLVSGLHTIVARPKQEVAPYFYGYYINSNSYHKQLLKLMQGTKVSSISKTNLKKTVVFFPNDLKEQENIGRVFKQLDDLITLHQRKTI